MFYKIPKTGKIKIFEHGSKKSWFLISFPFLIPEFFDGYTRYIPEFSHGYPECFLRFMTFGDKVLDMVSEMQLHLPYRSVMECSVFPE